MLMTGGIDVSLTSDVHEGEIANQACFALRMGHRVYVSRGLIVLSWPNKKKAFGPKNRSGLSTVRFV